MEIFTMRFGFVLEGGRLTEISFPKEATLGDLQAALADVQRRLVEASAPEKQAFTWLRLGLESLWQQHGHKSDNIRSSLEVFSKQQEYKIPLKALGWVDKRIF
jgi:hypothetical protein